MKKPPYSTKAGPEIAMFNEGSFVEYGDLFSRSSFVEYGDFSGKETAIFNEDWPSVDCGGFFLEYGFGA